MTTSRDVGGQVASIGAIVNDVQSGWALISGAQRNVGGLYPDVTIEELHRDELQITQHPIESGTPVTDHSYMQPVTIEVRCGWSNSSKQSEGYVQAVYSSLQKLQTARKPFDVVTGKRSYKNMLVRSLIIRTDEKSEFALMAVALCQEAIIVHTSGTGTGPPGAGGGPGRPPSGAGPKGSVSITDGNASTEDWQISTQSAAVESWPNLIGSVSNSQLALSGTEVTAFQ